MQLHSESTRSAILKLWLLALSYLLFGLLLGVIGGFQYLLPDFLKEKLSFQQTRPLHVYLVITWIFTAAQAGIYHYLPRVAGRPLWWTGGVTLHTWLQLSTTLLIIVSFFDGQFGGREYLEFPPWMGILIAVSWIPFALNFFLTLRPDYRHAPVYFWSWTTGILFFFITLSEAYLWVFRHFSDNPVRDTTVQWKAMGSMVGSWNMLVYGTAMYVMERISGDTAPARSKQAFFFYFLGFTNLLFNWGHHTYIVPAAPWVKTVAYVISMTELLILGKIIWEWRRSLSAARKNYHRIPYRLLSFGDAWIFLNLTLAIAISVPAWNYYTHGTHITVAHAMGSTIGINTFLLLASAFFILQEEQPDFPERYRRAIGRAAWLSNISLLLFWISLLGSGAVKISARLENKAFAEMMQQSAPWFRLFAWSGLALLIGLMVLLILVMGGYFPRAYGWAGNNPDPVPAGKQPAAQTD